MHRKIVLHLTPMATPAEAMDATEEDWLRDTMGEDGLSKQRFIVSWFELADLWTESMEASEYEEFLIGLLDAIVVQHPDGMIEWKDDRDIIMAAAGENKRALRLLSEELREDEEFILEAQKHALLAEIRRAAARAAVAEPDSGGGNAAGSEHPVSASTTSGAPKKEASFRRMSVPCR